MFDPRLFAGRVVLVSGAGGGVGSAVARLLRRCGAELAVTSRDSERLQPLADELCAQAIVADVVKVADCRRIVDEVVTRQGRLDALVNCAGVWTEGESALVTEEEWDRCVDVNLKGAFFLCARAIPRDDARFIDPEEVACLIAFLLSPPATPITGAALSMDFG